jgi:hypothetical protein
MFTIFKCSFVVCSGTNVVVRTDLTNKHDHDLIYTFYVHLGKILTFQIVKKNT